MNQTKKRHPNLTMHSKSSVSFRVLVKNRSNKQSQESYSQNISTIFQNPSTNQETSSVRSRSSHYSVQGIVP